MKVLLVGGGGREHALAWKLAQSPRISEIYAAPGNPGIAQLGECAPIGAQDINRLLELAQREEIDWTLVGPEAPLCDGLVDRFAAAGQKVFGPLKQAAQLEGSKVFAKRFMKEHDIPSADFEVFDSQEAAEDYLDGRKLPQVIKANGLAAGKGVFVCHRREDVDHALDQIFAKKAFGEAGRQIIIEECLEGTEASFLVFTDGNSVLPLAPAQDHKPVFDQNRGPNTGGMGTFCPTDTLSTGTQALVLEKIVRPTIDGMCEMGTPFRGILYVGLMLTANGPKVLEFNVRFGDPEAQVILPRLKTDLIDIFEAVTSGNLSKIQLEWDDRHAVCVVLASEGYPGPYRKGDLITGLDRIADPDVIAFHAGTKQENGKLVTNGGRVLGITALGKDRSEARTKAYDAIEKISWPGMHYRKDIGK